MNNLKQTTEQLIELAKVLNEFKSETVQIRLLELLFENKIMQPVGANEVTEQLEISDVTEVPESTTQLAPKAPKEPKAIKTKAVSKKPKQEVTREEPAEEVVETIEVAPSKKEKVKKQTKKTAKADAQKADAEKPSRKRSTTRPGPSVILKRLIDNKFFSDSRNIGDVVDYCLKMYKYEYKSTDLSGTLAKYAKEGILMRSKNPTTNQFEYTLP